MPHSKLAKMRKTVRGLKSQTALTLYLQFFRNKQRLIKIMVLVFTIVFMSVITAVSLVLKAPSGRDWVRKYYRDSIVGKDKFQFDLDTQLIFTKSKFEVSSYMPKFPGQSPHVDIKVQFL